MDKVAEATKWGIVSSVNPQNATARVVFSDRDNTVSYDVPITFANTGFAKIYSMPKVGQPVKCSFLGTGMEDGFIDGSFYNSDNPPPKTGDHLHYIAFDDGAIIEYDAESKIMTLKSGGGGIVLDDIVTVTKNLIVNNGIASGAGGGNVEITGSVTVSNDVTASGVSLTSHTHGGVQTGSGNTGGPQ